MGYDPADRVGPAGSLRVVPSNERLEFDVALDLSPFAAIVTGHTPLPADGRLSREASFILGLDNNDPVLVVVPMNPTNQSPMDLVEDVSVALSAAGVPVTASWQDDRLVLIAAPSDRTSVLTILTAADDPTVTELGLATPVTTPLAELLASQPAPVDGRLTADATFQLVVHDQTDRTVTWPPATPMTMSVWPIWRRIYSPHWPRRNWTCGSPSSKDTCSSRPRTRKATPFYG
jgi:hypothetical protein